MRPGKIQSISHYVRGIRGNYRRRISRIFRDLLAAGGVWESGDGHIPCNHRTREMLADSVFMIEDELESKCGGQCDHPAVVEMRTARLRINLDLGWDDP
jgi:hypothetical protein